MNLAMVVLIRMATTVLSPRHRDEDLSTLLIILPRLTVAYQKKGIFWRV